MADEKEVQKDSDKKTIFLDPSIQTEEERVKYVQNIIDTVDPELLTPKAINAMDNYILYKYNNDKKYKQHKDIITDNHAKVIKNREVSFEGLASKFENGEDGIYNMIANDKNIIFMPKVQITEKDIEEIPGLKELREGIKSVEEQAKRATGHKKFLLIKQTIEMKQQQYLLRSAYRKPIYLLNATRGFNKINFDDKVWIDEKTGEIKTEGFSLLNPDHVSALLCHYGTIKEDCYGHFDSDVYYIIMDLENLIDKTIKIDNPIYFKILVYKIDKKTNAEIARLIKQEFGKTYTDEYISSIWRQKIPKAIATQAQKEWIEWYYTFVEKGYWKRCSRCGEIKLGHTFFFSKNGSSRDGWYSLCKECRKKKKK